MSGTDINATSLTGLGSGLGYNQYDLQYMANQQLSDISITNPYKNMSNMFGTSLASPLMNFNPYGFGFGLGGNFDSDKYLEYMTKQAEVTKKVNAINNATIAPELEIQDNVKILEDTILSGKSQNMYSQYEALCDLIEAQQKEAGQVPSRAQIRAQVKTYYKKFTGRDLISDIKTNGSSSFDNGWNTGWAKVFGLESSDQNKTRKSTPEIIQKIDGTTVYDESEKFMEGSGKVCAHICQGAIALGLAILGLKKGGKLLSGLGKLIKP